MSKNKSNPQAYRGLLLDSLSSGRGVDCKLCLKPIENREDISVDHIKPRSKGGTSLFSNLQPSHARCNRQKGDRVL